MEQVRDHGSTLTEGRPAVVILRFILPILGCNLVQQFYALVDAALVGHILGDEALAVVGATTFINNFLTMLSSGLASGFALHGARSWGSGDEAGLRSGFAHSLALTVGLTAVLCALGFAGMNGLLTLMNTPGELIAESGRFLRIILAGLISTMIYNLTTAYLRAVGKSAVPFLILTACMGLNFVLALLFLRVLRLGVPGAAWATAAAQTVSALATAGYIALRVPMLHLHRADFRWNRALAGTLTRSGLAMALCSSIPEIGSMILQSAINTMSTMVISAYTVGRRVIGVAEAPPVAFGIGITTYVSQNLGAGKWGRIGRGIRASLVMELVWSALVLTGVCLWGPEIARAISGSGSAGLIWYADRYMLITLASFSPLCLLLLYRQAVQCLGGKVLPVVCSCLEVGVKLLMAGLILRLTGQARLGYLLVCLTEPITWVMNSGIIFAGYRLRWNRLDPMGQRDRPGG